MNTTLSPTQIVLSPSLLDSVAVGFALLVMITSSGLDAHDPFDTVHRSVALVPTATPVTVVLNDEALVIVAPPAIRLHDHVPIAGAVAFSVKVPELHCSISGPAFAALGVWSKRIVTSSLLGEHTPFVIVHRST